MQRSVEGSVKIGVAVGKSSSSEYALKWALENHIRPPSSSRSSTIYLIHIHPPLRSISTPIGISLPISEVNDVIVKHRQDENLKEIEKLVDKYKRICHEKKVLEPEVRKVEGDSIEQKLVEQISVLGLTKLVLGKSRSSIPRAFRRETVSEFVAKHALDFCTVMVVSKKKLYSPKQATEALNDIIPAATLAPIDGGSPQSTGFSSSEIESARSSSSDMGSSKDYENAIAREYALSSHQIAVVQAHTTATPQLRNEAVLSENMYRHSANDMRSVSRFEFTASPAEMSPSRSSIERPSLQFVTDPVTRAAVAMSDLPSEGTSSSVHRDTFAHRILPKLEENGHGEEENGYSSSAILLNENKLSAIPAQAEAEQKANAVNHAEQIEENVMKMIAEKEREQENISSHQDLSEILLLNQLNEFKLSASRALIEQTRAVEQIVQHAMKMIAVKERERDEALKALEMARYRSVDDERNLEVAAEELRTMAKRMDEYKSMLELANKRAEELGERPEEECRRCRSALEELNEESKLRHEAEQRASRQAAALESAMSTIRRLRKKYTVYSSEEIAKATDNFSESNKLGQGVYGPVYKGMLQDATVAIKILAQDGETGREIEEFEREVELLSGLRHPHILVVLGACPEKGSIVYEYMSHGSLEDRLQCEGDTLPLPWCVRFRICAEIAIALLFLHSRPEPIVHGDLKPGSILLDCSYVSKIGDVGLTKLVPQLEARASVMDPEYSVTGIVTHESDVFCLGIVMLQLLTGRQALGLVQLVQEAINKKNFYDVLDRSAGEWPFEKSMELAQLALECTKLQRSSRPNLETRILPVLETLRSCAAAMASASAQYRNHRP